MIDNFWSPVSRGSNNTINGSLSHHQNHLFRRSTNQDDVAREFEEEFEFEMKNITSRIPVKIVRRSYGQFNDSAIHDMNPFVYVHSEDTSNNDGEKEATPGWFELDMSGIGLRTISLDIKLYSHLTGLYLNNNRLSSIQDEVLLEMKSLVVLDLSSNLFQRVPLTLTQMNTLEKLYLNDNRITELPVEMGRLFRLKELNVEGNPLVAPPQGVIQGGVEVLIAYLRDRMPMGPPPPERRYIQYIDPTQYQISEKEKFKVLSYNILAESYASSEVYFYCPSWALDWNYRKQGILKEMLAYDSDIICLQEVESHQYSEFFEPELAKNGYAGVFSPKSRARTMEDWRTVDGCVIFFKRNKFSLVEEHLIEYQSIAISKHKELNLDPEVFSRLITKDNIGLAVILQLKGSGENYETISNKMVRQKPKYLLVCNTHIHWNPEHKDVKLIQVNMLVEQIANITSNKTKWFKIPMIVCGDFNSQPDSGPYELLGTGRIKAHHQDLEPFNYSIYSTHGITHNFQLGSAYAPIGEPPFTNYTSDYVGVLDYLWYSQDSLAVSKVLQPVDEEFVKLTRLPNAYMNSDHISLLSEFYFKRHQNGKS